MSKGKFLLIVNNAETFWSHRVALAKSIMEDGWELHLATSNASQDSRIAQMGMIPQDLPPYSSSLNPLGQARVLFEIFKTIRAVKPDILHTITLRYSFWAGLALHLIRPTPPAVFTIAGLGSLLESGKPQVKAVRLLVAPLFRIAFGGKKRFVIFQNPDDAKALLRLGAVEREQCAVIRGSGVDTKEFAFVPEPDNEIPIVLFSSRLLKAKGIGEFVHAARILKSKGIVARFQVAGDAGVGNHDAVSPEQIAQWKEEGTVEFLGKRKDMPQLMAQANIVTLPSYYGEGLPKVLLEAASVGRAIVTTDMPGCRETVEKDVTGILVEPKNAWSLSDALENLLKDAPLRKSMGEKGRARIEADFTIEKVNAKTLSVYKRFFPFKEKAALKKAA